MQNKEFETTFSTSLSQMKRSEKHALGKGSLLVAGDMG